MLVNFVNVKNSYSNKVLICMFYGHIRKSVYILYMQLRKIGLSLLPVFISFIYLVFIYLLFICFEANKHIAQAGLQFTLQLNIILNFLSSCLYLPHARTAHVCHHDLCWMVNPGLLSCIQGKKTLQQELYVHLVLFLFSLLNGNSSWNILDTRPLSDV